MGGQVVPVRPRRRRAAPAPAPARPTTRTPRCRSTPGTPAGHVPRPDPTRRSRSAIPTSRGRADGPLAARGPAVGPGHRRGHPRLVHETGRFGSTRFTFLRNDRRFSWTSGRSRSSACWVFFLQVDLCRRSAPDRRQAAVEAAPLLQLVQVSSLCSRTRSSRRRRSSGLSTGVGPPRAARGQRLLLTPPLLQPGDERDADSEEAGDLTLRALVLIHGRRDPLPQVYRRGTHGRYLLIRCRLLPRSCPSM